MTRAFRIYAGATVVAAGACLLVAGWDVSTPDIDRQWNALAAFLVLGFHSEASYLKLRVGRIETQSSVAFIPFIASVMLFDTGWAALIAAGAVLAVESVIKRKAPIRVAFNVGQMALSVALASWVYQAMGGGSSLGEFNFAPLSIAGAVVTYFAVNTAAVSVAVALGEGERVVTAWVRIAGASIVYDLFTSLLAPLLAYLYVAFQIPGILFLILPLYFVRHLYHLSLQLEQVNKDLLELMVKAIEARDPYTSGHSQRVSIIAAQLARESGLGSKLAEQISTAALLHDVGKIHEEYAPLLRKEGRLDGTEKALMQTHPAKSAELVSTISGFRGVIEESVRHHHENYDGSGYPMSIAGKSIPVGARIIMIADTVDAMTTDRPYRKALSFDRVTEELRLFAGKQFDPVLVDGFLRSVAIRNMVTARIDAQRAAEAVAVTQPASRGAREPHVAIKAWRAPAPS
jgi:putative nucleotidyltransferase with HDIG domain